MASHERADTNGRITMTLPMRTDQSPDAPPIPKVYVHTARYLISKKKKQRRLIVYKGSAVVRYSRDQWARLSPQPTHSAWRGR